MNNYTIANLAMTALAQFVTIITLLLVIRELQRRNEELRNERDELHNKLIAEIENHTERINQVGDLAAESARLKCELAKLRDTK